MLPILLLGIAYRLFISSHPPNPSPQIHIPQSDHPSAPDFNDIDDEQHQEEDEEDPRLPEGSISIFNPPFFLLLFR